MPERKEPEELQLFVPGLQQEGRLLRMSELSPVLEAATRLLLPRRRRANLRPQLPSLRQSLESVRFRFGTDKFRNCLKREQMSLCPIQAAQACSLS